jgi:hypothetical protein
MVVSKKILKLILLSFIVISFTDVIDQAQYIDGFLFLSNLTYVFGVTKYGSLFLLLYVLVIYSRWLLLIPRPAKYIFLCWSIFCLASIIRGFVNAEDYWDWKFLILENILRYSVHYAIIAGILFIPIISIKDFVNKWVFGFAFVLIFISMGKFDILFCYLVLPITLFIFFIPYSSNKIKMLYIIIALLSAVVAIEFRSNFLRLVVGSLIVLLYYSNFYKSVLFKIAFKPVYIFLFSVPIILLYLGISGTFNIFSDLITTEVLSANIDGAKNLAADSRTFLYLEVFRSLINEDAFLFGLGASGSYESYSFSYLVDNRRYATETGFLNVLLNMGVLGVILYCGVFLVASYYAIFKSNNSLSKMIGLFVVFRWMLFFVEDMTGYSVNMYFLWITIGMCYSKTFRDLTDKNLSDLIGKSKM